MKKTLIVFWVILVLVTLAACGAKVSEDNDDNGETISGIGSSGNPNTENLSKWEMAGKGVGKILPEPQQAYSLPQSESFIAAVIENATYEFFVDYVNQCIKAGFDGSIGTAEFPDYYYNGETVNGEKVQVMYYENEAQCSISAFPAE